MKDGENAFLSDFARPADPFYPEIFSSRLPWDQTGAVVARYDYDAWGRQTKLSGSLDADFGYAGYWNHKPSGLNLRWYRAYDAGLARWLSRDPIGEEGGYNLYAYVENSPTGSIDSLGLICEKEKKEYDDAKKYEGYICPLDPVGILCSQAKKETTIAQLAYLACLQSYRDLPKPPPPPQEFFDSLPKPGPNYDDVDPHFHPNPDNRDPFGVPIKRKPRNPLGPRPPK